MKRRQKNLGKEYNSLKWALKKRKFFVGAKGSCVLAAMYSQEELRELLENTQIALKLHNGSITEGALMDYKDFYKGLIHRISGFPKKRRSDYPVVLAYQILNLLTVSRF